MGVELSMFESSNLGVFGMILQKKKKKKKLYQYMLRLFKWYMFLIYESQSGILYEISFFFCFVHQLLQAAGAIKIHVLQFCHFSVSN